MSTLEEWLIRTEPKYRYMLLDRMRQDCDYYLGNGNRNPENLWAMNEKEQIEAMKTLWNSFPEEDTPEWLTMEQINEYEQKCVRLARRRKSTYSEKRNYVTYIQELIFLKKCLIRK